MLQSSEAGKGRCLGPSFSMGLLRPRRHNFYKMVKNIGTEHNEQSSGYQGSKKSRLGKETYYTNGVWVWADKKIQNFCPKVRIIIINHGGC